MTDAEATVDEGVQRRESIRSWRAAKPGRLAVLDDDPTGSQSVHHIDIVTVIDRSTLRDAFRLKNSAAFILTNTRGLSEPDAVALNHEVVDQLVAIDPTTEFVSRSDSTLRGHVLAEVSAIQARLQALTGQGADGVIFAPAFFEAGRFTEDDTHFATTSSGAVAVADTEFARDATFGYASSNLRAFVAEKSGGAIAVDEVLSIPLYAIRSGGPEAVRDILITAHDGQFIIVNGTTYSDYEVVVLGVQQAIDAGKRFVYRTGPSFVRALAGVEPQAPLGHESFGNLGSSAGHGLVVVGSHVSQTSRQLAAARVRGGLIEIELDVAQVIAQDSGYVDATAAAVIEALRRSDVVLYTSRGLVAGADAGRSLDIARVISTAVSSIVGRALAVEPAWVVAKGGITSHDVAVRGLGMRRAMVLGQMLPGQVSVFDPIDAAPGAVGIPYIVFAGNVGSDDTLADVVDTLRTAQRRQQ